MATKRKGADPVYAAEDAATGLYLNLDGERPQPVEFDEATTFPGTATPEPAAHQRRMSSARSSAAAPS
jgi:hypothetical protein